MRVKALSLVVAAIAAACATAPQGPSDAEVRAEVEAALTHAIQAIQSGDMESFLMHFAAQGTMVLRGVIGPDGTTLNVDLVGPEQIRPFLQQVGTPPDFGMQVSSFRREGMEVMQTGTWTVASDQSGPFSLTWHRSEQGDWRITIWRFDAG